MYWIKDKDRFLEIADMNETPLKFYETDGSEIKALLLAGHRNIGWKWNNLLEKPDKQAKIMRDLEEHGFCEVEVELFKRWD